MESIAIHGPRPHPFLAARIDAERAREDERLEQRARRHAERVIEACAANRPPCYNCGFGDCINDAGTRCYYCGANQVRSGEQRATGTQPTQRTTRSARTPAARDLHERAEFAGVRIEHSRHIGRIIDVR